MYRVMRIFDAQYCELYENSSKSAICPDARENQTSSLVEKEDGLVARKDVQFKGLCRSCKIRKTCTLPKPTEGVWHCEEFQ